MIREIRDKRCFFEDRDYADVRLDKQMLARELDRIGTVEKKAESQEDTGIAWRQPRLNV